MNNLGLIGSKIKHSISPIIHNIISNELGYKIKYNIYDFYDETISLNTIVDHLKTGKLKGINVTIPFKESITGWLDELKDKAKKIKAVNVIDSNDGKLTGYNTDYDGLMYLIRKTKENISGKKVYILGSGGASLTSYYVCKDLGAYPELVSRTPRQITDDIKAISYAKVDNDYAYVINGTPLGNINYLERSPLSEEQLEKKIVFDLNYIPAETIMMRQAKKGYNGLLMLVAQAVYAHLIWFKIKLTEKQIDEIVEKVLEGITHE